MAEDRSNPSLGADGLQVPNGNWAALPGICASFLLPQGGLAARSDSRKVGVALSHHWICMLRKTERPGEIVLAVRTGVPAHTGHEPARTCPGCCPRVLANPPAHCRHRS